MECNKDEAARAKEVAEKKCRMKDISGAKEFALRAQRLYPEMEGVSQMLATLDVYIAAEKKVNKEVDWYGILNASLHDDDETLKRKYRKLALMLHPDKNKFIGAEGAFKHVSEAWEFLSDKENRAEYDHRRQSQFSDTTAKYSTSDFTKTHYRDLAARAKETAEMNFKMKDISGAKEAALRGQRLYPEMEVFSQMLATFDVYIAAEKKVNKEVDWYGILNASMRDDDETLERKYMKLAQMLHPDKNKSIGAEGAFKHVSEAWKFLSDKENRAAYDHRRQSQFAKESTSDFINIPYTYRDFAAWRKEYAESLFKKKDFILAKTSVLVSQGMYPEMEVFSQMLATFDVYIAAEKKVNKEVDWYGILNASMRDDDETLERKYRKLAQMLHPDKNKSIGAEGAFKHVSEAWKFLSDKENRAAYDHRRETAFRDLAASAKEIAEMKFKMKDISGAKEFALKAQRLYPEMEGVTQMLATFDVYIAAEKKVNKEVDWYGILNASVCDDEETLERKYRKLAQMLHPDKNRSIGAEGALKHVSEAWKLLSDKENRAAYDHRRKKVQSVYQRLLVSYTTCFCNFANTTFTRKTAQRDDPLTQKHNPQKPFGNTQETGRADHHTTTPTSFAASGSSDRSKLNTFCRRCMCFLEAEY